MMAFTRRSLFIPLSLIGFAWSQGAQDDPIKAFCRRWGHSTARIDSRLYIDGGMVGNIPFKSNYSNDFLLFSDLTAQGGDGMPPQSNNLTKPKNVPSVSGGYIWADNTNKCFYQFGGEYADEPPTDFSMWTYDVLLDQWNSTATNGEKSPQRVSFGAGTQVEDRGFGFYFGGWLNNNTTPDWEGPSLATSGLMRFDFSTGELKNISGPDDSGRAEGHLTYLPVSDAGILMYFGGIEDHHRNGSSTPEIHIYDLASSKWYTQTASGDVPLTRRQFCADVSWPNDKSSFNIYMYGGYGFGALAAFDDVYILSVPSFKWIKAFPEGNVPETAVGHGGCTANVINGDQMIIMGGWFPTYDQCDAPDSQGQHNMVLGYNGGETKLWDKFDPSLSGYVVPTPIMSAVGGGPTGGATVTAPATWGHPDLATYYTLRPTFPARTATRLVPSAAASSTSSDSDRSNIAAIAGGTVGGLFGAIAIISLIIFCLHRRKKAPKNDVADQHPPTPPPAELAATAFPHEISTSTAGKYVAMHERSPNSGATQICSQSASYEPYANQHPPSYGLPSSSADTNLAQPVASTQHSPHQQDGSEQFHAPNNRTAQNISPTWDQQGTISVASARQHSYPTPTSPGRASLDLPIQRPPLTYYPPPESYEDRTVAQRQYSEGLQRQSPNTSTSTTPAQFYSLPALRPQNESHGTGSQTPTGRNTESRFVEAEYI
ncbi:hypothetical protein IAQ61_000011 [Plenodomus lingam]|uniref:Cell wall anchored protein n=1 Tax=Leptosphaeria maculans (strain JN3 / isolate v23.1.3 / race Av1-4-5-6-7-8) TaxID=985895 RepID=E5R416_LEPMJ|nr:hypothetical protein LEMA_P044990.1 [Plenodomus lingam JN3]KAH9881289.1 hypothetical protein IAQ61_000011 [Plenodomus lingam]CBX91793.1 hypothetical protein LEMA_P044990.1 [Plenodomus lingam JN3]